MEKTAPSRGHSFSIEMTSRIDINKLSMSRESKGVLVEGDLGRRIHVEVVEGIMLQISGENGVFRIDLGEGEADAIRSSLSKK